MQAHGGSGWEADVLEGRPDGRPPLVLLHRPGLDRAMWRPALAELCAADPGRQVLVLDLPGRAGSAPWPGYDLVRAAAAVHEAVRWTRLDAPVMVGHAMAAAIATVYAACYPVRGVVNVDQWLEGAPSVALVTSPRDEIRGDGLTGAWQQFADSTHLQRLLPPGRWPLRQAGHPRQDAVAGYWGESLGRLPGAVAAEVQAALAAVRAAGIGYLFIAGREVEPGYRRWLSQVLPQASIVVFPGGGHFPHLACPRRFATCLAATARWDAPGSRAAAPGAPRDLAAAPLQLPGVLS